MTALLLQEQVVMRFLFYLLILSTALLWQVDANATPAGCDGTTTLGSVLYGNAKLCGLYTSVSGGYTFSAEKLSIGEDRNNPSYATTHTTTSLAPMATSAVGYNFYRNFEIPLRIEFAYGYQGKYTQNSHVQQYDSTTGELIDINRDYQYQNQTLFYNAYYDLHSSHLGKLVPYIGMGVGFAQNRGRGETDEATLAWHHNITPAEQHWAPAWNMALGTDYILSDHWAVGARWRMANLGWHDLAGTTNATRQNNYLDNHTLTSDVAFLIRYEF